MKNLIYSIIISFFCVMISSAQAKVTVDKFRATEGQGALTSGFDVVISLSNSKGLLFVGQSNNERANIRVGKKFGNFTVFATGGAFKNIPWLGPIFTYNHNWFYFFSWTGFGMTEDNQMSDLGWNPNFFFNYEETGVSLGKNGFAYAIQFFATNKPDHFLVYKRSFPLDGNKRFFIETTYHFTKKIPMFVLGYEQSFKH